MRCYRCDKQPPMTFSTICRVCDLELRAKRNAVPLKEFCKTCGLKFINDWERMKHEIVGLHHYRAWPADGQGRVGMASREFLVPEAPLQESEGNR